MESTVGIQGQLRKHENMERIRVRFRKERRKHGTWRKHAWVAMK